MLLAAIKSFLSYLIGIAMVCALITAFLFSPFYAPAVLWILQTFTPIEVNLTAAQNQTPKQHHQNTSQWSMTQGQAHQNIAGFQPHAIVILGGGLQRDAYTRQIVPNDYTIKRLDAAIQLERQYALPIVLSGVEAPYMQQWLMQHHLHVHFLEKKSLNTCENTRFTALLLQQQGGVPQIFLITDAYHMPRARELFADNGIATVPVEAPLPQPLTRWQIARQNWIHTRRANYELLALLSNRIFGARSCRETPS